MSSSPSSSATELKDLTDAVDTLWTLLGACMVFMMQTGFAMLEVGSVSIKNSKNILIKNIGDSVMGAIGWWLLGHGVAFGKDWGGFIGCSGFGLKGEKEFGTSSGEFVASAYASWLFQWAFAATATTIVSGAMAERATFGAYAGYSVLISTLIYPVVVHWVWGDDGWANPRNDEGDRLFECGVIDFAGSGVVHMTGGVAALVGVMILGPRAGRFNVDGSANFMPAQSTVLQTLGTLLLWWGWLGFNGASAPSVVEMPQVVSKVMVVTVIGGASGAMSSLLLHKRKWGWWDVGATNNGILVGLVSVTAGCATLEPEGAFIAGAVGGLVYYFSSNLLVRLRIDDVVDAAPVHLFGGIWGLLVPGLLSTRYNYEAAYDSQRDASCHGLFYGGGMRAFAANVVFCLAVVSWVGALSLTLFVFVKLTVGIRVSKKQEMAGLDDSKHGGQTYPELRAPPRDSTAFGSNAVKSMSHQGSPSTSTTTA